MLHKWDLSYAQARQLQVKLAGKVEFTPVKGRPKVVAGLDCAFSKDGKRIFAAVVVLRIPEFEVIETAYAVGKVIFPYIPGLLSFREAPVCLAAVEKLQERPDVFIIDGQGVAHPRRLGLAAHLGLFFDTPTIGCAKSRLIGDYEEPPLKKGSHTLLIDEFRFSTVDSQSATDNRQSAIIGSVVRTRTNVKPVFVSVGHQCTLDDAIEITLACTSRYRLPEPTRLAHQQVGKLKA